MKWILLIALFCVSCGSDPISQPFLAKPLKKKEKSEAKPEAEEQVKPTNQEKAEPQEKAKTALKAAKPQKTFAGMVTFQNLSEEQLAAFRVIPEKGTKLVVPKNMTYPQVDGFWWSGNKTGEWFKIPGSSEAWIGAGEAPKKFDETVDRDNLKVHYRSNGLVHLVGIMKNGVKQPGWYHDGGKTKSPIPSPWRTGS